MDVPPFSMAYGQRKWELFENHAFQIAMSKKSHGWFFFDK